MTDTAQTASDAYERYMLFRIEGRLIQSAWHKEVDGRQLACGLGVLGNDISSPRNCPADIMPGWLAQMVPWFFDRQRQTDAFEWGERFYSELKRLNGAVPFSVVHDWHVSAVGPLAIEVAVKRKRPIEPHQAVIDLHRRALAGEAITADQWRSPLKTAYAYAYADAYADADANANADAYANAYADAYADANADADADADAYADANADADADADAYADAVKSLADGMIQCLARVPPATINLAS